MGATQSKPQLVFKTESPVEFSDELLNQIQNISDNDYVRQQKAEQYIQEEVSKALATLEQETLSTFENKLNTSLLSKASESEDGVAPELSSKQLTDSVSSMNNHLNKLIDQQVNKVGSSVQKEEMQSIKSSLLKCLTDNKGKPLNCYEEVQKFKELAESI
ncbi:hypothetical protein ACO0RG_004612 [Hanseniaspora osmophila]|uniref:MICOS complex subunit MIC19 n=1 Tax=Hanseniaspora osmophila TaxID=56408 RepID=A0A1E5RZX3_9ASCO|nr:MICOS complex subunit MIC19 [Hanseniaspora osmophila]